MSIKYKQQIVDIAASWWTNVITNAKMDCGATGRDDLFTEALGYMLKKPSSQNELDKFKKVLANYLNSEFDRVFKENENNCIILDCDYSPCKVLRDIAEQCNISTNNFPWKTTMWIGKNYCEVKYGYSSPIEYLFTCKEYWQDRIKLDKESILQYESEPESNFTIFSKQSLIEEAENRLHETEKQYRKFLEANGNE